MIQKLLHILEKGRGLIYTLSYGTEVINLISENLIQYKNHGFSKASLFEDLRIPKADLSLQRQCKTFIVIHKHQVDLST